MKVGMLELTGQDVFSPGDSDVSKTLLLSLTSPKPTSLPKPMLLSGP